MSSIVLKFLLTLCALVAFPPASNSRLGELSLANLDALSVDFGCWDRPDDLKSRDLVASSCG